MLDGMLDMVKVHGSAAMFKICVYINHLPCDDAILANFMKDH